MKNFKTIVEMKSKLTGAEWLAVCELGQFVTNRNGEWAEHSYFCHEIDRLTAEGAAAMTPENVNV